MAGCKGSLLSILPPNHLGKGDEYIMGEEQKSERVISQLLGLVIIAVVFISVLVYYVLTK
jgi:hypothetical protein